MKPLIALFAFIFLLSCNPNNAVEGNEPDSFEEAIEQEAEGEFPSIGQQIIAARERKGLSQTELAKSIGVSKQNIADIEDGRVIPTRDIVVAIQKMLDCEIVLD